MLVGLQSHIDPSVGRKFFLAQEPLPQAFMPPQSGVASNGLTIYNWDQAAAQLIRDSGGWGAGAVVTYGFRASAPAQMPAGVSGFSPFTSAQIAMTIESLALWSEEYYLCSRTDERRVYK